MLSPNQPTKSMTRNQLIKALAQETSLTESRTRYVLDALTSLIVLTVSKGEKVSITNLGTFDLGSRAARHGVNPKTHLDIQIPEMAMPRFRAGKRFKEGIRK
jgi:DNA-binding protein HU-beta